MSVRTMPIHTPILHEKTAVNARMTNPFVSLLILITLLVVTRYLFERVRNELGNVAPRRERDVRLVVLVVIILRVESSRHAHELGCFVVCHHLFARNFDKVAVPELVFVVFECFKFGHCFVPRTPSLLGSGRVRRVAATPTEGIHNGVGMRESFKRPLQRGDGGLVYESTGSVPHLARVLARVTLARTNRNTERLAAAPVTDNASR